MSGREQRIYTREEFCSQVLAPLAVAINRVQLTLKYRATDRQKVYEHLTKAFSLVHKGFHDIDFSQQVALEDLSKAQDYVRTMIQLEEAK